MIQAEIHNKATGVENLEDVLTSNVFGLLRYIKAKVWLPAVLADLETRNNLKLDQRWKQEIATLTMEFWKKWPKKGKRGHTEPDLVTHLDLQSDTTITAHIVWEMKLSWHLGEDQFYRELQGLHEDEGQSTDPKLLVHLSRATLKALQDFEKRRSEDQFLALEKTSRIQVCHYTWEWLLETLQNLPEDRGAIICDVIAYLRHKGFEAFKGFGTGPEIAGEVHYVFEEVAAPSWSWPKEPVIGTKGYTYG